ncbi:MAG: hypothetical protein KC486_19480 [Myxococcales bacterium]|nr:hypothetical protein [Myxococcales bacterium]
MQSEVPEGDVEVSEPAPAEPEEPCPPVDYAALEPDKRHPDTRTIALTRIFAAPKPPKAAKGQAPRVDLGELRLPRRSRDKGGWGAGMGWEGLSASWVDGTLRPSIAASFADWDEGRRRYLDHQRGAYLLDTRVRYARTITPPESWGSARCLKVALTEAKRAEAAAKAEVEAEAKVLRAALEAAERRSAGEKLLLAVLLADALPYPYSEGDVARSLALLAEVADDEAAGRELRARAAEQSARISPARGEPFKAHLERVLQLSTDPELRIETMIKLTALSGDAAEREAMRVRIVDGIEHLEGDEHHLGWRLAHVLADLAEDRLERGAYDLAIADAARCARASAADFRRDPDPWGCASTLAEAMATQTAAPENVEVPLAFLGPLAVASMRSALRRFDREQARRLGELLLAELPEAAQAPAVLVLLDAVASTEAQRDVLAARLERDYGSASAWAQAQRERLAWSYGPDDVDAELAKLRASTDAAVPRAPQTRSELEAELRLRAGAVIGACAALVDDPKRKVGVAVDTRGALPKATIRGADRPAVACLRREVGAWFRSLDPLRVSFTIVANEVVLHHG